MTPRDQEQLAQQVNREAATKVSVKLGQTNGRYCIHVNDRDPRDPSRSSFTYYSEAEWALSDLNRANRPSRGAQARSEAQESAPGVLGSTAFDAVLPPEPEGADEHKLRWTLT